MKYHPLIFVYIIGCFAHYSIGSILFQRQNVSSISITDSVTSNDTDISFNTETTTVTLETTALPAKQPLTGTPRTIPVTSASATVTAEESRSENLILHRIPTQLEEKLAALSCDLPLLPSESRLWNGNETHELLLPITVCYFVFFLHPSPYLKPTSLPSTSTLNISSSNIEIRGYKNAYCVSWRSTQINVLLACKLRAINTFMKGKCGSIFLSVKGVLWISQYVITLSSPLTRRIS